MVITLQHGEIYAERVKGVVEMSETPVQCASCNTAITFINYDLLLGSKPQNCPLFVASCIKEQKVDCILIDGGSVVNIMPKSIMYELGITIEGFSKSRIVIQGFNLESQRSIYMIRVKLVMGDLSTSFIFRVIDSKTSYKMLLRWPWLHEHGIVTFSLYQCLKYYRGGEKKINGSVKLFTRVESHSADARFFEEDDTPKEAMLASTTSTGKGGMKNAIKVPKEDMPTHQLQKEEN